MFTHRIVSSFMKHKSDRKYDWVATNTCISQFSSVLYSSFSLLDHFLLLHAHDDNHISSCQPIPPHPTLWTSMMFSAETSNQSVQCDNLLHKHVLKHSIFHWNGRT